MPRHFFELTHELVTPEGSTVLEGVESPISGWIFTRQVVKETRKTTSSEGIVLLGLSVYTNCTYLIMFNEASDLQLRGG